MKKTKTPRGLAARAICKIETEKAYSNLLINSLLKESELTKEDKALATLIIYGTLDRKVVIDYYLKKFVNTPLKKIKPYTLAVMRTAVYQIKFTDRIPNSAAVNEAVKLIKNSNEAYNSGFVNAVLRSVADNEIELPSGNDINSISVRYSCPASLVSVLIKDYGAEDTKAFLQNSLLPPPLFLRVNTTKTSAEDLKLRLESKGIAAQNVFKDAIKADGITNIEELDEFANGLFHVEELACQMAISALGIEENDRVLDLCAAPGGKSFTAAEETHKGEVISCDIYEKRTHLIEKGAARLGLQNISTRVLDATKPNFDEASFDKIICDVPCSGFGVIRRKPDIKYKPVNSFDELISTQREILNNASSYLKQGGKILYSTCTLHRAENDDVVNEFLENHKDFKLNYIHTFLPQTDGTDGFFAAVLEKI